MKKLLLALGLMVAITPSRAAYFGTILDNPAHPYTSLTTSLKPDGSYDGTGARFALVFHKGTLSDTIIPQKLLDLGLRPTSWTLLGVGAGGSKEDGYLSFGPSVNLAPTLMGPLGKALAKTGKPLAVSIANFITASNGNGLALGGSWKAHIIQNGKAAPPNAWRMVPRADLGVAWGF